MWASTGLSCIGLSFPISDGRPMRLSYSTDVRPSKNLLYNSQEEMSEFPSEMQSLRQTDALQLTATNALKVVTENGSEPFFQGTLWRKCMQAKGFEGENA